MMFNQKLWTALITPMNGDGSIDYDSLEKLVSLQESAGNGILLIGSTGEGLALEDAERKEIIDFVSGLKPDVPVMVGVGGMNINHQKSWIRYCNQKNIDAFLLVTPLYAKPGPAGQLEWFTQLLNESDKPCMIYNIPSRTGIELPFDVAKSLAKHPRMWAIKEASGNLATYLKFRQEVPAVPLYSGDDALLAFFTPGGCAGVVSVASNVWPEATSLYAQKCLDGDTENLFPLWTRAVKALFSVSNPIPAKRLLHDKGVIGSPALRLPLIADELTDLESIRQIDSEIETWYNKNR